MSIFDIDRIAATVGTYHAIEEFNVEHRRVSGTPSIDIACRCGQHFDFFDFTDHVAREAAKAAHQELVEEGVL